MFDDLEDGLVFMCINDCRIYYVQADIELLWTHVMMYGMD